MAEMTRTTPSGVSILESDYQTIKKQATKETLVKVFAIIGVGATAVFLRNAWNGKAVKLSSIVTD